VVEDKKRSRNSRKQPKADDCWLNKPIPTYNTFEGLEEVPENENNNTREVKPFSIFIPKNSKPSSATAERNH